jgi:hypothetical protein
LLPRANHHDATVRTGWVCPDVAEATIQRHDDPACLAGGSQHRSVASTSETLVQNRVDMVAGCLERVAALAGMLSSSLNLTRQ